MRVEHRTLRIAVIAFFALLITFGIAYWVMAYRKTIEVHDRLKSASSNIEHQQQWQQRLVSEQHLLTMIDQSGVRGFRWLGMNDVDDIYQSINQHYQYDIEHSLVPYLKKITEAALNQQSALNPLGLYQATKAYCLASTDYNRQQPDFQQQWYAPLITASLQPALQQAIEQRLLHWNSDPRLLAQTRAKFQTLDTADIAFLVIQNYYPTTRIKITVPDNVSHIIQTRELNVPELYSSHFFFNAYRKQIPAMAAQAVHGDWVTGRIEHGWHSSPEGDELIKKVQASYLEQYQLQWQHQLQQLTLNDTPDLKSLASLITELQNEQSPIWSLITTLNNNSTLYNKAPTPLANFLSKNRGYQGFQAALYLLQKNLQPIIHNNNPQAASFAYTASRMQSDNARDDLNLSFAVAKQLPHPISQWLTDINHRFWQLSLNNSKQYIQHQWSEEVLRPYHAYIAQRYPVYSYAKATIAPKQFDRFFAPNGTLDAFVQHYFSPFIEQGSRHWSLKQKNGNSLALSKPHLDMLTRAKLIRDMFYKDNSKHAHTTFSLDAKQLGKHTQRAILNIEGQMYTVSEKHLDSQHFSWPGPYPGFVTVQLTDERGKAVTKTYSGPWAWFKALDHSRLSTSEQLNQYTVHVNLNDYDADYTLTADDIINPFIPHVLAQFRCPMNI